MSTNDALIALAAQIAPGYGLQSGEVLKLLIDAVAGNGNINTITIVPAQGVTGTVSYNLLNAAITLALGAITPSSVAATGTVTGSNLSGTNTGDQTIILTGAVTGAGTGSFATTLSSGVVSLNNMASLAANSIIGNNTASPATPLALSVSQTKTLLSLNNVENTALSTWGGTTNITTLGTITSGVWNAGAITSSGDIAYTGQAYGNVQTLTDATTIAWNMDLGGIAKLTLGASRTMGAPTNIHAGATYALRVVSAGFAITWNSAFKWPGGTAPVSTGGTDVYTFISFDGSTLDGVGQISFS